MWHRHCWSVSSRCYAPSYPGSEQTRSEPDQRRSWWRMWRSRQARTLLVASVVTSTVAPLTACGASSGSSAAAATIQREATLYQIDQIERTFHEAGATHNVNLMMTLWAP